MCAGPGPCMLPMGGGGGGGAWRVFRVCARRSLLSGSVCGDIFTEPVNRLNPPGFPRKRRAGRVSAWTFPVIFKSLKKYIFLMMPRYTHTHTAITSLISTPPPSCHLFISPPHRSHVRRHDVERTANVEKATTKTRKTTPAQTKTSNKK